MGFQIRNLVIKLAPNKAEGVTLEPTEPPDACMPQSVCCDCGTSQHKDFCEDLSLGEPPGQPGYPEDAGNEDPRVRPKKGPEGLGLLRHQLRRTLRQAD